MKPLAKNENGEVDAPFRSLTIVSNIVESDETLLANYKSAIARKLPTIHIKNAHLGKWVICGGGPSLKTELKSIKKQKKRGDIIVSVNGTHDYLLSKGIKPDVFIMLDPKESNINFVKNPQKGITYYIAACCHPSIFDALEGYDLKIWYPIQKIGEDALIEASPVQVGGGSTVGLRAISLGYVIGYRDFHLYGFDGCMKNNDHHAYLQQENNDKKIIDIVFQNTVYWCQMWMAGQAQDYIKFLTLNGDLMKIKTHSPGLIKHIGDYYYASRS